MADYILSKGRFVKQNILVRRAWKVWDRDHFRASLQATRDGRANGVRAVIVHVTEGRRRNVVIMV